MSEHKAKAVALRALLKNKDIARQVFDAIKAPHGSTKQKTAARLLRSVGRFSDNKFNDGQGGPGLPMAGPMQPPVLQQKMPAAPRLPMAGARTPAPAPAQPPAAMAQAPVQPAPPSLIAHGIDDLVPNLMSKSMKTPAQASATTPPAPIKSPVMVPPPFDFSLGPKPAYAAEIERNGEYSQGEVDQMFLQCVQAGGKAMACALKGKEATGMMVSWETAKKWAHQSTSTGLSPIMSKDRVMSDAGSGQVFSGGDKAASDAASAMIFKKGPSAPGSVGSGTGTPATGSASGTDMTGSASGTDKTGSASGTQQPGGSTSSSTGTDQSSTTGTSGTSESTGDDIGDLFYSAGTTDIMRLWKAALEGKTGDAAVDDWMKELQKRDPAAYARFLPIYNNFKSRTDAPGAILDIITDPDQLAVTLGIPKEMLDKMPWDIFGGPKLADLRAVARKSAKLDQWEAELKNRQTSHLYADEIFKGYVLGKDEFLKKVDTMLHEYDDYLRTVDRSDPRTRRMMQNYRNYLITLKGITQQKYINIINTSLKLESADYQRFYTMYQTAAADAKALENQLISQASNSWKTIVPLITKSVENMYNHLSKVSTASYDSFKQQVDMLTAAAKASKELAGAAAESSDTVTDAQGNKTTTKVSTRNGVTTTTVTKKDANGNVVSTSSSTNTSGVVKDHGPKTVTTFEGANNEITVKTTTTVSGGVTKVDVKKYDQQGKLISSTTGTSDATGNIEPVNVYKPIKKATTDKLYTTPPTSKKEGVPGKLTPGAVYDIAKADNVDPKELFKTYVKALQTSLGSAIAAGNFADLGSYLEPLRDMSGVPEEDVEAMRTVADAAIVATVPPAVVEYLKTDVPSKNLSAALADLGSGKGGFDWANLAENILFPQFNTPANWENPFSRKKGATRESFIKKYEKSISPVVLGILWDANQNPQSWLEPGAEKVEKVPGVPLTYTKEEWDTYKNDPGALADHIGYGTANFLAANPGYSF